MKDSFNIQQFLHAPSDTDYLDQLITAIHDACTTGREHSLESQLQSFSDQREQEIERLCNSNHQEFVASVNQLLNVRKGTVDLTDEILKLNESIQTSTQKVVEHKKALVDSRDVRQNIDEATQALRLCLEVLGLANRVEELLRNKKHYAALRTLDELQNVHLKEVVQFDVAEMIQNSVPAMQGMVKEAVMTDLNSWLYRIRESSQLLGQVAFYQTELRRRRQKERVEKSPYLRLFKLNSAIELVLDEREEFDVLDNEDIRIAFEPLFECLHIHEALGERDEFRLIYTDTRRQQKELLMPASLTLTNDEISPLNHLLESIAGFAILEKATMKKTRNFRSAMDVDELWDSMCKKAIAIIGPALKGITVADTLLKVKNILSLFIQTMDSWGYSCDAWDSYLLILFAEYSKLLKKEFCDDFREIMSNEDFGPMTANTPEDYEKVVEVSWFKDPVENREFPTVLPFSQMYPLCCIDIRTFLNKYYFFSQHYFQNEIAIDDELKASLDELLCSQVCKQLVDRLQSNNLGQLVQILINLEQFETASRELEQLLVDARQSNQGGSISLKATTRFKEEKKTAEKRIFELVNSKIDELVETSDYSWMGTKPKDKPSEYLQQMTLFLNNIMGSALLALPEDIKGLIYFDALSHIATSIIALPRSESVKKINKTAVKDLATDVAYLQKFVSGLGQPMLLEVFVELGQTVDLLQNDNPDEFYDIGLRMKKYANVDPLTGPILLEKLMMGESEMKTPAAPARTGFAAKFR
ncbi:exocyst complex subunit Sec15-like-domain-containing protein [Pyronema domesticum]|uniref:Exocyst complex component SEC15 n=1 Tax=Pyronema omphalodes (strain CBS 100304) TaxID=1076935 RepID=U4LHC9_PYROM|nr:exocyst complex subunit Sec15-like-domain-containing protein [Pyronema domesticum]CCX31529.1 Similar to Exocyst complex component sec15; acc. no. O75006 [Pyronema omphalodes CBS 100304]